MHSPPFPPIEEDEALLLKPFEFSQRSTLASLVLYARVSSHISRPIFSLLLSFLSSMLRFVEESLLLMFIFSSSSSEEEEEEEEGSSIFCSIFFCLCFFFAVISLSLVIARALRASLRFLLPEIRLFSRERVLMSLLVSLSLFTLRGALLLCKLSLYSLSLSLSS
jgi:amino acid transporter